MKLWSVALVVILLNLPFGYWRANTARFSWQWFMAVHLPVPFIVAVRIAGGLGWKISTFPVLVGAYFTGQFFGARVWHWFKMSSACNPTSCLFKDLLRKAQGKID